MKYSSERAMRSSSRAMSRSGLRPVTSKTSSAVRLMMLARGSYALYTRCPNPINFSSLFFTFSRNAGMFSTLPMRASIRRTASFAPPCKGP